MQASSVNHSYSRLSLHSLNGVFTSAHASLTSGWIFYGSLDTYMKKVFHRYEFLNESLNWNPVRISFHKSHRGMAFRRYVPTYGV